jgi:hypothetical protein
MADGYPPRSIQQLLRRHVWWSYRTETGSKALRQRQRMIAEKGDVKVFSPAEPLC